MFGDGVSVVVVDGWGRGFSTLSVMLAFATGQAGMSRAWLGYTIGLKHLTFSSVPSS